MATKAITGLELELLLEVNGMKRPSDTHPLRWEKVQRLVEVTLLQLDKIQQLAESFPLQWD